MQAKEIADKARALMPGVIEDLEKLVAIPSIAFPGYPSEPMDRMGATTLQMFRDVGFTNAQLMEVPSGYPPIYAEIEGPEGSPVVVLYAHYDVQPAPPEQGWTSDPWTPTHKDDGRIYGRGAADDISGLVSHLGTLRVFGGPAPDAMMALARLLSTLHDDEGNVSIAGASTSVWDGADLTEDDLRSSADVLDGVELTGTGRIGDLLWARPSVNAIGVDMTNIATSSNVLIPEARAKISMRIVPGSEPDAELDALVAHLETHAPWGAKVEVQRTKAAPPFLCKTDGPGNAAARDALAEAYGRPAGEAGCGGSIPLLRTLETAAPGAEFVLWGPEDVAAARIHASDESVDPSEIEKMIVAQALLLQRLADGAGVGSG